MEKLDVSRTMQDALNYGQEKQDVITLAKSVRAGLVNVEILALNNGFMVSLRPIDHTQSPHNFVFTRANKIGTLVHTLFNSDLDKVKAVTRLRRLMGYL